MMAKPTESRALLEDPSHLTVAPDLRKVHNCCVVIGMVVGKSLEDFTSVSTFFFQISF
jgi:hypothetical protein